MRLVYAKKYKCILTTEPELPYFNVWFPITLTEATTLRNRLSSIQKADQGQVEVNIAVVTYR